MRVRSVSVLMLLALLVPGSSNAATSFIAVSWSGGGRVFGIDEVGQEARLIGTSGVDGFNSLAMDRDGRLIAATGANYYEIDPDTGGATLVLSHGQASGNRSILVRGVTFGPDGTFYTVGSNGPLGYYLFTMNLVTRVAAGVGAIGFNDIQALEFSPSGTLYGWSVSQGLIVIDPTTGSGTPLVPDAGGPVMQSLAFRPDGLAYGASLINLWRIDLATGATSRVGESYPGASLRGLAFVPEPAAVTLILTVCLAGLRPYD